MLTLYYILRIEDKNGRGCYSTPLTKKMLGNHIGDDIYHPTPYQDKKISRDRKHGEVCGFLNWIQLLRWFNIRQLILLAGMGFYIKRVKVILTAIGETQVLGKRVERSRL